MSATWKLIVADVIEGLAQIESDSVQCVVTSPPYWGLRDYGVEGMIGLEPTLGEHMAKLVEVFGEVRRVLRPDGTVWLNYGDAYSSGGQSGLAEYGRKHGMGGGHSDAQAKVAFKRKGKAETKANRKRAAEKGYDVGSWGASEGAAEGFDRCEGDSGLAPKQRLLLPHRLAIALQDDGWWVRSEIVWAKGVSFCPTYAGSCMPSSVRDRPTDSHEFVYLLSKAPRYFYDGDAVREAATMRPQRRTSRKGRPAEGRPPGQPQDAGLEAMARDDPGQDTAGRNLRTVWTINPQAYPEAHFATFAEALVEPCIRAGTSGHGACSECGAPWRRVVEAKGGTIGESWHDHADDMGAGNTKGGHARREGLKDYRREHKGWEPTCEHAGAPVRPCLVLDPFNGSGTTGVVALREGCSYVGIELNPEYAALAEKRIEAAAPSLFCKRTP